MTRVAADSARVLVWVLLVAGLCVVALNPGVPSLGYAFLWLGILAVARGISWLAPELAVTIDLSLLFVCLLGLEIGGLILAPSVLGFALADALRRHPVAGCRHRWRRQTLSDRRQARTSRRVRRAS